MMLCAHSYHCNVLHYIQIVPPPEPEGQLCDLFTFESLLTSCWLNCTELLSVPKLYPKVASYMIHYHISMQVSSPLNP